MHYRDFFRRNDDNTAFLFFYNLDEKPLHWFKTNWKRLAKAKNFDGRQLAIILYSIATKMIHHPKGREAQEAAIDYMAENFINWLGQVLINRHSFNGDNNALAIWSLAVIESQYPDADFSQAYHFLRKKLPLPDLNVAEYANKLRDADIWFTGETEIKPLYEKGKIGASEDVLMRQFEEAGIMTFRTETDVLPKMPGAIDFVGLNFEWGEALDEVDGSYHFLNGSLSLNEEDDIENLIVASEGLRYNAHTLFRAALKSRLAPQERILHIDFMLQCALLAQEIKNPDSDDHLIFIQDVHERLSHTAPGSYRARMLVDGHITSMIPQPTKVFKPAAWGQLPHPPLYEDGNVELLVPHDRPRLLSPESLRLKTLAAQ